MDCSKCGKQIPEDANLCPYCGNKIKKETKEEKPKEKVYGVSAKSRTLSMCLCILGLLGFAGIHRMYVGKWWTGILYMLTFGLCGFGTLYDIYKLYAETFHDCDGYPLYSSSSMKKNYRRREPNSSPNKAAIFCSIASILFACSIINPILNPPTPSKSSEQVKNQETKKDVKTKEDNNKKKNQESELELVEKVKQSYKDNDFIAASNALGKLKNLYPNTTYVEALNKDYPDLEQKAGKEREKRKKEAEKAVQEFNREMSNSSVSAIYEGYGTERGGVKFCVYVNSHWHSLSEGQKKTFTEIAYTTYKKYGLDYPSFYVVNEASGRNVAHYGVFGISIDD